MKDQQRWRQTRRGTTYRFDEPKVVVSAYTVGYRYNQRTWHRKVVFDGIINSLKMAILRWDEIHLPKVGWFYRRKNPRPEPYRFKCNPHLLRRMQRSIPVPNWNIYGLSESLTEKENLFLDRVMAGEDGGNLLDVAEDTREDLIDAIMERGRLIKNWQLLIDSHKKIRHEIDQKVHRLDESIRKMRKHLLEVIDAHAIETPLRDSVISLSTMKTQDRVMEEMLDLPEEVPAKIVITLNGEEHVLEANVKCKTNLAGLPYMDLSLINSKIELAVSKTRAKERMVADGTEELPGVRLITKQRTIVVR